MTYAETPQAVVVLLPVRTAVGASRPGIRMVVEEILGLVGAEGRPVVLAWDSKMLDLRLRKSL